MIKKHQVKWKTKQGVKCDEVFNTYQVAFVYAQNIKPNVAWVSINNKRIK